MKNKYNDAIDNIQKNHTANLMEHRDFLEYKSHLHDQSDELEFEKNFKESNLHSHRRSLVGNIVPIKGTWINSKFIDNLNFLI